MAIGMARTLGNNPFMFGQTMSIVLDGSELDLKAGWGNMLDVRVAVMKKVTLATMDLGESRDIPHKSDR
jgi:hypothetical protein